MKLKHLARIVLPYALLLAVVVGITLTVFWQDPLAWLQSVLQISGYYLSLVFYFVILTVATIFAPLTVAVTIPFMAKIFGAFSIFVVTWTSWMVGAMVAYAVSRRYGRPLAGKLFSINRIEKLDKQLPKHLDFWTLVLMRIFMPVDALSYAAGLKRDTPVHTYFFASAFGMLPFAFILSYGPEALTSGSSWLLFVFFVVLFIIASALAIFYFSSMTQPKVQIYTHSGGFHTDDVFAVATLGLILDQQQRRYEIIRTRDESVLKKAREQAYAGKEVFIVDIGGVYDELHGMYDHHQQEGAGVRESGVSYASFGLVWKKYGIRLCESQEAVEMADKMFVQAIDAPDNGQVLFTLNDTAITPVTMTDIIERYYQSSEAQSAQEQDSNFYDAVTWAKSILPRVAGWSEARVHKEELAGSIYAEAEDKRLMISEERVGRALFTRFEEPLLSLSPRREGEEWGVVTIPTRESILQGRIAFPEAWWGLNDEELQKVSGIKGAKFCHRAGDFLCVAYSKKSALELAHKTLEAYETEQKNLS